MYDLESTRSLVREAVPDYRPSDQWLLAMAKVLNTLEEYWRADAIKFRES